MNNSFIKNNNNSNNNNNNNNNNNSTIMKTFYVEFKSSDGKPFLINQSGDDILDVEEELSEWVSDHFGATAYDLTPISSDPPKYRIDIELPTSVNSSELINQTGFVDVPIRFTITDELINGGKRKKIRKQSHKKYKKTQKKRKQNHRKTKYRK